MNCTAGDIRIKVDNSNPVEKARAKKMITEMLGRGYLLAIDVGDGKLEPISKFDPKTEEYVIIESASPDVVEPEAKPAKRPKGRPRGAYKEKRVPMDKAKVTAVPRTAGG